MTPVRYDWATGDRWWGRHVHLKMPDEPIGYAAWFEWAKKRGKTHRQVECSTPGCPILRWSDDSLAGSRCSDSPAGQDVAS